MESEGYHNTQRVDAFSPSAVESKWLNAGYEICAPCKA